MFGYGVSSTTANVWHFVGRPGMAVGAAYLGVYGALNVQGTLGVFIWTVPAAVWYLAFLPAALADAFLHVAPWWALLVFPAMLGGCMVSALLGGWAGIWPTSALAAVLAARVLASDFFLAR